MLHLILTGRIPSKKNSTRRIMRGGRIFTVPSKAYEDWQKEHLYNLNLKKISLRQNIEEIEITIFAPDKRKSDLTNKAESIMDLLVDAHIIPDDNWFVVPKIILLFGGVDRNYPRAEINIF